MRRTNATAAISVSRAGRRFPNSSTASGLISTARFSLVFGYACSSRREIASMSLCAAATVTPGLRRASAAKPREPRSAIVLGDAYIANGTHNSAVSLSPLKPGGITPTTVYCLAAQHRVSVRPMTCGSAPDRRFQKPSLRTTTGAGLATMSSLASNTRPRAGETPSSEKYGAATNSVWIRSGSSLPTNVIHCESTAAMSSKLFDCARQSR
jgi:hypothetical protein